MVGSFVINKIKRAPFAIRMFLNKHLDECIYFLKKRRFKKLRNLIWTQLWVRDLDGGKLDWFFRKFPGYAPYPKELEIEITTRCHLKCIMCENAHWENSNYRKQDMTLEMFKTVIDKFPRLRYINVTGEGTCIMNKDFFKMLEYLNKKSVNTMFVESFDLLKEDYLRKIVELDVERIEVSLDGARKDTYENIRRGAKWDRVIENLQKLREIKKEGKTPFPYIFFRFIAMKNNVHEIPDLLRLVADLDINLGKMTDVQVVGLLTFPEIEHLYTELPEQFLCEANSLAEKLNINFICSHTSNNYCSMNTCAKWLQPYIIINGDVVLDCALLMANNRNELMSNSLGNVFTQSFKEIWNSPRYKRIRESVNKAHGPVAATCKGCRGYDTSERELLYGVFDDKKS